jgi:hypothetical protein
MIGYNLDMSHFAGLAARLGVFRTMISEIYALRVASCPLGDY